MENNLTNALNVLHAQKEKIYHAYVFKQISKHEKHVDILMIPNGDGWHYVTVKSYLHY